MDRRPREGRGAPMAAARVLAAAAACAVAARGAPPREARPLDSGPVDGGAAQPCTVADYEAVRGQCSAHSPAGPPEPGAGRTVGYRKRTGDSCVGVSALRSSATTDCACALDEYEPIYGPCRRSLSQPEREERRPITGYRPGGDCVLDQHVVEQLCGGELPTADRDCGQTFCSCGAEDVGTTYTECDPATASRMLTFFWKDTCIPDDPAVQLPAARPVDCVQECPDGTFLTLGDCVNCSAGTFSIKGEEFTPPWRTWPSAFQTHCAADGVLGHCEKWQLRGDYIDSGNQSGRHGLFTSLTIWSTIRSLPALLRLSYRMESEAGRDMFYVFVNGGGAARASGMVRKWTTITVDLMQDGRACAFHLRTFYGGGNTTACVYRNRFEPYAPAVHFDVSQEQGAWWRTDELRPGLPRANTTGCSAADWDFSGPAGPRRRWGAVLRRDRYAPVGGYGCDAASAARAAQAAGASAMIVLTGMAPTTVEVAGTPDRPLSSANLSIPVVFVSTILDPGAARALTSRAEAVSVRVERAEAELGKVEIELMYAKDWSISTGADRVYVRDIEILGTEPAAKACMPCPRGHYSAPGAAECLPCPANHYAPNFNTSVCLPCPPRHTAAPGQAHCVFQPNCTDADYVPELGPCQDLDCSVYDPECPPHSGLHAMHQKLTFRAVGCIEQGEPPPPRYVPCDACDPGMFRQKVSGGQSDLVLGQYRCVPCPGGQYVVNPAGHTAEERCSPCSEKARAAVPELLYSRGFRAMDGILPSDWSARCSPALGGLCWPFDAAATAGGWMEQRQGLVDYKAWRTWLSAGHRIANLSDASLELSLNVTLSAGGRLNFSYAASAQYLPDLRGVAVEWSAWRQQENQVVALAHDLLDAFRDAGRPPAAGPLSEQFTKVVELPPGDYEIRWVYTKSAATEADVVFYLSGLEVSGALSGGALQCTDCPPGLSCRNGQMSACGPGQYADAEHWCRPCPPGAVAPFAGSAACEPCTAGLQPNGANEVCVPPDNCVLTLMRGPDQMPCSLGDDCREQEYNLAALPNGGRFAGIRRKNATAAAPGARSGAWVGEDARLDLDLCGFIDTQRGWREPTRDGQPLRQGFAIQTIAAESRSYSIGRQMAAETIVYGDTVGVRIVLSGGDRCTSDPGVRYRTVVDLLCDATGATAQDPGEMLRDTAREDRLCEFHFVMRGAAACPLCRNSSYRKTHLHEWGQRGDCLSNGSKVTLWIRTDEDNLCNGDPAAGGLPQPPPLEESCGIELEAAAGFNVATVVGIFVVLLLLGLGSYAVHLFKGNRALQTKYQQLSHRQQTMVHQMDTLQMDSGTPQGSASPARDSPGAAAAAPPAQAVSPGAHAAAGAASPTTSRAPYRRSPEADGAAI
eukprot:TRINITY_DN1883_c0_g1_i1.p1 TRINITY_DN1883_c0_g1~~TRINITY_DN1883_c0_g1_i1.p1  ORF type:complete len:1370 (+),score=282.06 TRINITY_DN1883_c0_g1_i1:64-4173(+)